MKKLFLLLLIFGIFLISSVSAITYRQVYFDGFESNNLAANWTANAKYSISTGVVYAGTYAVLADGGNADVLMTITNGLNVSNQTSCNLTAVMQIHSNFDGNEYLCLDYSTDGGTSWNMNTGSDGAIGGLCQDGNVDTETAWRNVTYNFNPAGIQSFKFRFRQNSNNANEDGYIDNVNLTCYSNDAPVISNITASNTTFKGGSTITIYANTTSHGVNDTENDTLYFYCDSTNTPNSTNTDCTGGTLTDSARPYIFTCTYAAPSTDTSYTEFCRVYDGNSYSSAVNVTYTTDSTAPTTTITSVAGDTAASYFDSDNDGRTDIIISGETGMSCRWSSSDVAYSGMSNTCSVSGTTGNCSVNDALTQGFITRYVSCQDLWTNEQNSSNNLNVQFYLDYTAPNTTDNSVASVQLPGYIVTIIESDNVDSDPTSYYCTSTSAGCDPTTLIDNLGTITYNSSNRGANYLRYYSIDDAGNTQITVNKTVNINRLPSFLSAWDNAVVIKGGSTVNVSANISDLDSGQEATLFVCSSLGASSSGCTSGHYCNSTGTGNLSCVFSSELDSASHTWYAYVYDELGEAASDNPRIGSYTTDYTSPIITLINPGNGSTITQNSVTISISVNEALTNAWYSLNGNANVSMTNTSLYAYSHQNTSIANGNYNLTVYANDSYGNIASLFGNWFVIDNTAGDTTAPVITIISPINNTYYNSSSVILNITSDEALSWAGYVLDSGSLSNLHNSSNTLIWNATLTSLSEGRHNITFYANDSSSNKNQGNKSIFIYVDLNNPQVSSFSCNDANDSQNVTCSADVSDSLGLSYALIGYNATGSWINSSSISLSGTSSSLTYTIGAGNTTMPGFTANLYLFDNSGRTNFTKSDDVVISDDTSPGIYNISYYPNSSDALDPYIRININATIYENWNISSVVLMWTNSSDGLWRTVAMNNNSEINNSGAMNINYNASFVPGNGTYSWKINATDTAGNFNISGLYTLIVTNESSFYNSTSIASINSFTYAQRLDNNTLGWIYLNNTGDSQMTFDILISSGISSRFNINYTLDDNASYALNSGEAVNLTFLVNTTSLTSGLYPYNITINSIAGTTIYQNNLNVQVAEGAYLSILINTYSSSVTSGQTGVEFSASVSNLGTQDASNVVLNWTLPSEFSLSSGNLSRNLGTLPIGSSGSNTIQISVSSSGDKYVNMNTIATASNADSVNTSKQVAIGSPLTVIQVISGGGGSSVSSGGGKAEAVVISRNVDVVAGKKQSFDVEIYNPYLNTTLENLSASLLGYLSQYYEISPKFIDRISYGQKKNFTIILKAPSYKNYEEYLINISVSGLKISQAGSQSYSQKQYIRVIINEISKKDADSYLEKAEKIINEMKNNGFYINNAYKLLQDAKGKYNLGNYGEVKRLVNEITAIIDNAYKAYGLINSIKYSLQNPRSGIKSGNVSVLIGEGSVGLTGNAVRAGIVGSVDYNISNTKSGITGYSVLANEDVVNTLLLAIMNFERGDYENSLQTAEKAKVMLMMERRGNIGFFLYLYWWAILIGFLGFLFVGAVSYKVYMKKTISRKIMDLIKEEESIRDSISEKQQAYYSGKMPDSDFRDSLSQYHKRLAEVKKEELRLRNKRVRLLKPEKVIRDLDLESKELLNAIKKLQGDYFSLNKVSKKDYEEELKAYNERLASVEGERLTLETLYNKKKDDRKPIKKVENRGIAKERKPIKIFNPFKFIKRLFESWNRKKEAKLKEKINKMLKNGQS
jgi:hypothetical protein